MLLALSVSANIGLLGAIAAIGFVPPKPGSSDPSEVEADVSELALNVLREKKAMLEKNDTPPATEGGADVEEKFVEMPWLLMAQTLGRADRMIGIDGELSADLCRALMIGQVERSILEGEIRNGMQKIREIEKSGSSLQQDEDGSSYYRIDPNVAEASQVIKKLEESARQILDSERGHYIATMLGEQAIFQIESRIVEIAAVESGGAYQLVTTRVGVDGDEQREPRIMDRLGLISLESRWGHIVDIERWKAYVAENPPESLPRIDTPMDSVPGIYMPLSKNPKTGSLLLDGISDDGSFWD